MAASTTPLASRIAALLCLALASTSLVSCEETAFGMSLALLREILAGSDPAPILALSDRELASPGALGSEAFYYLGRWIEDRVGGGAKDEAARAKAAALYRRAYERCEGTARREAARSLAAALAALEDWKGLAAFARERRRAEGPDWGPDRAGLDALAELGLDAELLDALAAARADFPAESAATADALACLEARALRRLSDPHWPAAMRAVLLERQMTDSAAAALAELQSTEPPDPAFSAAEYAAARLRVAVMRRDYGAAYREALPHLDALLTPGSPQALVADIGRAFLYSDMAAEGLPLFFSLESEASSPERTDPEGAGRIAWYALFYRARLTAALGRRSEAAGLFRRAAAGAPSATDADAALWYWVESVSEAAMAAAIAEAGGPSAGASKVRAAERSARADALGALVEASSAWKNPASFLDLADGLFRDAIRARDWRLVFAMSGVLAGKLPRELGAALDYAAARALELKYYVPADLAARGAEAVAAEARSRLAIIAADARVGLHYRSLAAWRAGAAFSPMMAAPAALSASAEESAEAEPPDAAAPPAGAAGGASAGPAKPKRPPEEESFILGFLEFGLADLAASRARAASRSGSLGLDSLRSLAEALAVSGSHDGSLRLATAYVARPDWVPLRSDYELLYPRPYLDEYRAIEPPPACPEPVFFGLVRSESLFRADVVSRAGAIGLAQLMPATAGEVAARLKIASYDLTRPGDNLRLGASLFSSLLEEADAPLRAMMAYNAGRGRLRRWKAESGDLPDDLMLEAIDIAETRQYGRNILAASAAYGQLYYGIAPAETARYAIEGGGLKSGAD